MSLRSSGFNQTIWCRLLAFHGSHPGLVSQRISETHDLDFPTVSASARPREQGCKENLVDSPRQWPEATSAKAHTTDWKVRGLWFDRTAEYRARRKGEDFPKLRFAEELELTPIPSWRHRPTHKIDADVRALIREIETETRGRLEATGREPLGRRAILEQDPHGRPASFKPSPAPRFHAKRRHVRRKLENAYRRFYYAYREASERLRQGLEAEFPPGSFLPSPGFHPPPG